MSGYGFDEPTRQIIEGALAAAVASAAASRDDPIDPIRHIAFYLLPNDDVQAVFHVHELLTNSLPKLMLSGEDSRGRVGVRFSAQTNASLLVSFANATLVSVGMVLLSSWWRPGRMRLTTARPATAQPMPTARRSRCAGVSSIKVRVRRGVGQTCACTLVRRLSPPVLPKGGQV